VEYLSLESVAMYFDTGTGSCCAVRDELTEDAGNVHARAQLLRFLYQRHGPAQADAA